MVPRYGSSLPLETHTAIEPCHRNTHRHRSRRVSHHHLVTMSFPPFPLSKSLWMKWKVSVKKKKHKLKPVEAAGAGGGGEGDERAIVLALPVDESSSSPLQLQMEEQSRMVMMDASFFDCASCSAALKPPTFKCDAGHVVCQDCRASHVEVCTAADSSIRCPDMDRMVRAAMVFCVHKDRGCTGTVPYHELAEHLRSCRFAPPSCVVNVSSNLDSGKTTAAAASASGSPTTPAPATRPKRDHRPNPRYAGPSWTT